MAANTLGQNHHAGTVNRLVERALRGYGENGQNVRAGGKEQQFCRFNEQQAARLL
jgi:hypothetical protein